MILSGGTGVYVAGENHAVVVARLAKPGASRVVLGLNGSHSTVANSPPGASQWALADSGFLVMQADHGQPVAGGFGTYGNDTVITRIGQMRTFMQSSARHVPAAAGKVILSGGSGGCTGALNYAFRNPADVACMALALPLVDVEDLYNNRTDGVVTQAEMDTAYGGHPAFLTAMPSHSPKNQDKTVLAGIPMLLHYSTNDPYISVQSVMDFRDAVNGAGGNVTVVSLGAVGHNNSAVDRQSVIDFFKAYS